MGVQVKEQAEGRWDDHAVQLLGREVGGRVLTGGSGERRHCEGSVLDAGEEVGERWTRGGRLMLASRVHDGSLAARGLASSKGGGEGDSRTVTLTR